MNCARVGIKFREVSLPLLGYGFLQVPTSLDRSSILLTVILESVGQIFR